MIPGALLAPLFLLAVETTSAPPQRPSALPSAPAADSVVGPGAAVPFLAQGPLLCGGAAAAMVERWWGALGVYADDYAELVRPAEGGIRASELTRALTTRGLTVDTLPPVRDAITDALRRGAPPIVLIGPATASLHYVVVVAADPTGVWLHDPKLAPSRRLTWDDFERRWEAARRWGVTAVPTDATGGAARAGSTLGAERDTSAPPVQRDLAVGAASPSDPANATVQAALSALREGRFGEARALVSSLLEGRGSEVELGWRVIATSHHLEGNGREALAAWNAVSEPSVDLVAVHGARHSRFEAFRLAVPVEHGATLRWRHLEAAGRRLEMLPSVRGARVDYRPLRDGSVQVDAFVSERDRLPRLPDLAMELAGAFTSASATVEVGPLFGAADRWRLGASWEGAWSFVDASVAAVAPPLPGVVAIGFEWRRERYAGPRPMALSAHDRTEERARSSVEWRHWITARTRIGTTLAVETWDADVRVASGGVALLRRLASDRISLGADVEGWTGGGQRYGRVSALASTRLERADGFALRSVLGAVTTSSGAPRMVWPGAGTGAGRSPLLRAHPLASDGAIAGPGFGPSLLHATVELRRFRELAGYRAGLALFADGARVGWPVSNGWRTLLDVGVGAFFDTGAREGMLSLAFGKAGWVWSGKVETRVGGM